ncbi:HD domain-containing phosphohydrolase [Deinococcus sp. YIM 134068]|uniref:HD domain-containing phosphohydrolase n=1 Tax=Deinococcus lichenicola TaxID=3118910 RepID=UPI002F95D3DC
MRRHPARSAVPHLPAAWHLLCAVRLAVRHHHERSAVAGYADRPSGNATPLLAHILAVRDVYDALISPRSYQPTGMASGGCHAGVQHPGWATFWPVSRRGTGGGSGSAAGARRSGPTEAKGRDQQRALEINIGGVCGPPTSLAQGLTAAL